ncbi:MAG: carboxypeptidase regulatory-like domain-containing protein, partial [Phycisphaerales bacterium]
MRTHNPFRRQSRPGAHLYAIAAAAVMWSGGASATFAEYYIAVVSVWTEPSRPVQGENASIWIRVRNLGTETPEPGTQHLADVHVCEPGADAGCDSCGHWHWQGVDVSLLAPGDTREFSFDQLYTFDQVGTYGLCARLIFLSLPTVCVCTSVTIGPPSTQVVVVVQNSDDDPLDVQYRVDDSDSDWLFVERGDVVWSPPIHVAGDAWHWVYIDWWDPDVGNRLSQQEERYVSTGATEYFDFEIPLHIPLIQVETNVENNIFTAHATASSDSVAGVGVYVVDVSVELGEDPPVTWVRHGTTNDDGVVSFDFTADPGEYKWGAWYAGLKVGEGQFEVEASGDLSGLVKDGLTGDPVAGADVTVGEKQTLTEDPEGTFFFRGLAVGDTAVSVSAAGYYDVSESVTIEEGSEGSIGIVMTPEVAGTDPVVPEVRGRYCGPGKHVYYLNR